MSSNLQLRYRRAVLTLFAFSLSFGTAISSASGQTLSAGSDDVAVVKENGTLWTWGSNSEGQLGLEADGDQTVPTRVGSASDWSQVASGAAHKVAIREDGSLWSWGRNVEGQLGRGDAESASLPGRVGLANDWAVVAAGGTHTLALKEDGSLWVWGGNASGQLGNGSTTDRGEPLQLAGGPFSAIAAGESHSLAIGEDGSLWAWGDNFFGTLGLSDTTQRREPTRVGSANDWSGVAAGQHHSLGARANGSLWAWGSNSVGQLGLGSVSSKETSPKSLGSGWDPNHISAGGFHSLALKADGTLWSWGDNSFGQLGLGSVSLNEPQRQQVGAENDWVAISAGANHSVALRANGELWSAGRNHRGQLGTGTTDDRNSLSPSDFGLPDLALTEITPTGTLALGQPFSMNVFGSNTGSGDVEEPFEITAVLSSTRNWNDSENESLGNFSVTQSIGAGENFNVTGEPSLPSSLPAGNYFFGGRVDEGDAVAEIDEENNIFWTEDPIPFLADLTVDSFAPPADVFGRGDPLNVSIPVQNIGLGDTSPETPVAIQVRLSLDKIWGNSDDLVIEESQLIEGGIPADPDAVLPVDVSSAIPAFAPLGSYHVGVWIDLDEVVEEEDEGNNLHWSSAANVTVEGLSMEDVLGSIEEAYNGALTWSLSGDGFWFGQEQEQLDGSPTVQSPPLAVGESVSFDTTVTGPAVVTFNWKADTNSADNYLAFSIDGAEQDRVFGSVDWHERSFLLPGSSNKLKWTYVKEDETDGSDRVWVGGIGFAQVNDPDFVIMDIDYEPGEYVLQRDSITIRALGKNQGASAQLPDDFRMEVRLSRVAEWEDDEINENVVLGHLDKFQDLDGDNRFVYQSTLDLPSSIPAGAYSIGVFADSTEAVAEFDETNNIAWSASDISIEHRPDIRIRNLDYEPGIYTIFPPEGEDRDELTLSFDLENVGLEDVPAEPLTVQVVLSPDRELGNGSDSFLVEFEVSDGLHAGQSRPYDVTTILPEGTTIGMFQYIGVIADGANDVPESREDNNTAISDLPNVFVQELTLGVAVHRRDVDWITGSTREDPPWYGQRDIFFSHRDPTGAARPAKNMRIDDQAHMETRVTVDGPSVVSFFWKVDSDQVFINEQLVAHNYLSFSIDGQELVIISGDVDWHQRSFSLPEAGTYTLRWSYIKDVLASNSADTGWVDRVTLTAPDLVASNFELLSEDDQVISSAAYVPGDSFKYRVTITNEGLLSVPSTPSYSLQVRASQGIDTPAHLDWTTTDASDVILDTVEFTNQELRTLAPGEHFIHEGEGTVPGGISESADFFIGAWVDYTDRIAEADLQNNLIWTETKNVSLLAPTSLSDALGLVPDHPDGWVTGGNASWSGQENPGAVNGSAAQSPVIQNNEEAWFEAEIEGPVLLDFNWKVSSKEGFNFLRLYVSGQREKQISGEVDWTPGGTVFIPAGPQTIRWSYEKTSSSGGEDLDTAWVDDVQLTDVTQPDLLITGVDFDPDVLNPDPYVLERHRFSLTVTGQNRGTDLPGGLSWDATDMEIRLSSNRKVGDEDDFILGHFARVESFDSGSRLVFSGDLELPLDLPAGNYYLIATIDPHAKLDDFGGEFDDENNTWISSDNDVPIRRLPHLVPDNVVYDNIKAYFPYTPFDMDWVLRNRGLGNVTGQTPYVQEVKLMAFKLTDEFKLENVIDVAPLSIFTETSYLPGVSDVHPQGSGLPIYSRMTLPSPATILAGLGEVDAGLEEEDARVLENWFKIEQDYVYFIAIEVDSEVAVEQSSDLRITYFFEGMFNIMSPASKPAGYGAWAGLYPGIGTTTDDDDGDGLMNWFEYAFNRNPVGVDTAGPSIYQAYGTTVIHDQEYFRITFDIVKTAEDLIYTVEATSDIGDPNSWQPLVVIEPPFEDVHGDDSLTGVNGLKASEELVIAASDQGFSARVTVRDSEAVGDSGQRFLRVSVNAPPP